MAGGTVGTSLGVAPALLVAQQAQIVDLDGPLRLAVDRGARLRYDGSTTHSADPNFWGGAVDIGASASGLVGRPVHAGFALRGLGYSVVRAWRLELP
jgi:hypothetical protein